MCDDTKIPTRTQNELAKQLERLETALRKTIHAPNCNAERACPQQCDCRQGLKRLNNYTAIVWQAAQTTGYAVNAFHGWRGDDKLYGRMALQNLRAVMQNLRDAFQFHEGKYAMALSSIFSWSYRITDILYGKLCTNRYDYNETKDIARYLEIITNKNLRVGD